MSPQDKPSASLFIEILDRFIYLFSRENPSCEVKFLSGLIAHINEQLGLDAQGGQASAVEPFYRNTLGASCPLLSASTPCFALSRSLTLSLSVSLTL